MRKIFSFCPALVENSGILTLLFNLEYIIQFNLIGLFKKKGFYVIFSLSIFKLQHEEAPM